MHILTHSKEAAPVSRKVWMVELVQNRDSEIGVA